MYDYIGRTDPGGRRHVWVSERHDPPTPEEVTGVLRDLAGLRDLNQALPAYDLRRAEVITRKADVIRRIELSEVSPERIELTPPGDGPEDGFAWGSSSAGSAALAREILAHHLGAAPDAGLCRDFAGTVLARLDADRFGIDSADIESYLDRRAERQGSSIRHALSVAPSGNSPDLPPTPPRPDAGATGPAIGGSGDGRRALVPAAPGAADLGPDAETQAGDPATASALVAACEAAWADVTAHHPDLPEAVMVLGTGVERGRLTKLGHWWGGRWIADGAVRGEVLLAGEALHLAPPEVFEILLHEAAHGLSAARRIPDTSRGGRYHNRRFAATAREVLLDVAELPPYGMARTTLSAAAHDRYGPTIERLGEAMRIARQLERGVTLGVDEDGRGGSGRDTTGSGAGTRGSQKGSVSALCGCGRRLRMAPSVMAAGPVLCGLCGNEFEPGVMRARSARPAASPVTSHRGAAPGADLPVAHDLSPDAAPRETEDAARAAGVVARGRARIAAALDAAGDSSSPGLDPLRKRLERIDRVRAASAAGVAAVPVPSTASQRAAVAGLTGDQSRPDPDLDRWYEDFGTPAEAPMQARGTDDARHRIALAQALLRADGTITGPSLQADSATFAAGDRVVTTLVGAVRDLPEGSLGTVDSVDVDRRALEVDFATWGRLRASVAEVVALGLRHDYVEHDPLITAPGHDGSDPELAQQLVLEANRIDPGAGW